jgi:nucleotide-binding universal stress UspA family protein
MYRLLLPVDDDERRARRLLETVCDLPGRSDLSVAVLSVDERRSAPDAEWAAGGFAEEFEEAMVESRREERTLPDAVTLVAEGLESAGIEHSVHRVTGDPAAAILAAAEERESDAIVVGVRSRSPVGKVVFGSAAQVVILDSDRPVITVPVE